MAIHIGVDLAWGDRARTGLAALDEQGALLSLGDARTDDEIVSWLEPFVAGPCLVGIDAPLVVRNATGRRQCEADLNAVYARYDAGAHPSNTGKPEFAGGTRGARIAAHLGLDIDPASTSHRRAIEVYPHPATIALFGLDRTIKYKHKPGRDLAFLRAESLRLIEHLESLGHADPALHVRDSLEWQGVRSHVTRASRKSEIRAVEDSIDAVLCAYIALYAAVRPDDITVFGDADNGYIVTPALPDSAPPPMRTRTRGRPSRLSDEDVLLRFVGS